MVGGRGVRVADFSAVRDAPLVSGGGRRSRRIRGAGAAGFGRRARRGFRRSTFRCGPRSSSTPRSDGCSRGGGCIGKTCCWKKAPLTLPEGDETAAILAAAAAERFDDVFPWDDEDTAGYLNRVRCLAAWMPELNLPSFDTDAVKSHPAASLSRLPVAGRSSPRRLAWPLARDALAAAIAGRRAKRRSGSRCPAAAASSCTTSRASRRCWRCGFKRSSACWRRRVSPARRVPVLLHLLAPNHRPQQVTDDLASFWRTTYHQVRKDLRRRYPKHAWPEDPYTATAERRPGSGKRDVS